MGARAPGTRLVLQALLVIPVVMSSRAPCAQIIQATPPPDRQARIERFEQRNNRENLEKLARRLAGMIDLTHPGVADGFARHYRQGRYAAALDAYRDYVLGKLREPGRYGIPAGCVKLQPPANPSCDKMMVRSPADELMRNVFTARSLKIDVGRPGGINWLFVPKAWQQKGKRAATLEGSDDHTGDTPMLPRTEAWRKGPADFARHLRFPKFFNHLLDQYAKTGDRAHVEKWAAFIDDWCMHQKADADRSALNVHLYIPQQVERLEYFLGNLAFVARRRATLQQHLPGSTLVRLLLRRLSETAAATIRHLRYFESNWRFLASRGLIDMGLLFPEFRLSEAMIREGRRGVEVSHVLCELPDGSDYELTPNYWGTYLGWAARPMMQLYRDRPQEWMTPVWRAEIRHHTWMRARAILAHLMPNGQWPIAPPQDRRNQVGEYDRPALREVIPEFFNVPDTARRLNRAFADKSPSRRSAEAMNAGTDPPSYASEWLPYGGWYFLRGGWDPNDPFLFMKSASHVIGHGGPFTLWANNNAVSLYAFGEELLFLHHITPVTVDGLEQDVRAGLPYCGHMGYMLAKAIRAKPKQARWHDSDSFAFAEGIYDKPYGRPGRHVRTWLLGVKPPPIVTDVTHTRQIHFVKPLGLWVITDRLTSRDEHHYTQKWHLHIPEKSDYGPIYGFTKDEVLVDRATGTVKTSNPSGPNLSFHQIGSAPLTMTAQLAPPNPTGVHSWTTKGRDPRYIEKENYLFAFTISRIRTSWKGRGHQLLITVAYPRKTKDVDLRRLTRVEGTGGLYGFDAVLPTGEQVAYRVVPDNNGTIRLGGVTMTGESLLVATMKDGHQRGVALGCKRLAVEGADQTLETDSAEFTVVGGQRPRITSIYKPIDPVRISPDVDVFADSVGVTMTSQTPGVIIHYTLDGSDPTPDSPTYAGPVRLTQSATVKARAFRKGVTEVPPTLCGTHATLVSRAVFTKQTPRKADHPTGLARGLDYAYFEGPWQDLMLLLDQLEPIRRGTVSEALDTPAANRRSHFAFRYTGYFEAPRDGVYTFYAPDPMYDPNQINRETGYDLQVRVGDRLWDPGTRHHAFGTWSIALRRGLHPIEIAYVDYRGGKEDLYFPNTEYGCVWQSGPPSLQIGGPGMARQQIPSELLSRRR